MAVSRQGLTPPKAPPRRGTLDRQHRLRMAALGRPRFPVSFAADPSAIATRILGMISDDYDSIRILNLPRIF